MRLQDAVDRQAHIIGSNSGLNTIDDFMEPRELKHNYQDISKYCGQNCKSIKLRVVGEIRRNKVHTKI